MSSVADSEIKEEGASRPVDSSPSALSDTSRECSKSQLCNYTELKGTEDGQDETDGGATKQQKHIFRINGWQRPFHFAQVLLWVFMIILAILHFGVVCGYIQSREGRTVAYVVRENPSGVLV